MEVLGSYSHHRFQRLHEISVSAFHYSLKKFPLEKFPLENVPLERFPPEMFSLERFSLERFPLERLPLKKSDAFCLLVKTELRAPETP